MDISANAAAWLALCERDADRSIAPCLRASGSNGQRHIWKKMRELAGIPQWPHNALRHTFASMHYALHQNEAKLQAQMGHESAAMLHRHYRAIKTRAEAEVFWSLAPRRHDAQPSSRRGS